MTLSTKDHHMSSHKMVCFSNKKGNNKVVLYLAVHHGCEHSHSSECEPYVPYAIGVSRPMPSQRKPYVLYVMDVGSPIPFQGTESFPYMLYVKQAVTSMLF